MPDLSPGFAFNPYLNGLVSVRQNVKQVCRGNEVESREGQAFCLQVLSQSLLTDGQSNRKPGREKNTVKNVLVFNLCKVIVLLKLTSLLEKLNASLGLDWSVEASPRCFIRVTQTPPFLQCF